MLAIEQSSVQPASVARPSRLIAMENARKGRRNRRSPEIARFRRSSHDREIPPQWRGRGPGSFRGATQGGQTSEVGGSSGSNGMARFLEVSAQTQAQQSSYTPNPICGFADATSANHGETITFSISTSLPASRIDIYLAAAGWVALQLRTDSSLDLPPYVRLSFKMQGTVVGQKYAIYLLDANWNNLTSSLPQSNHGGNPAPGHPVAQRLESARRLHRQRMLVPY